MDGRDRLACGLAESLETLLLHEGDDQPRHLVGRLVEDEVTGIQLMDLGVWHVAFEGVAARRDERGIVPSSDRQRRRLVLA